MYINKDVQRFESVEHLLLAIILNNIILMM